MRILNPGTISGIRTRNRIIRAAVHERAADENGKVTSAYIAIHEELARRGVGMSITGFLFVNPIGKSSHFQAGIENDERTFQLQELTSAVHRHGGTIVAQICHGGRQSNPKLLNGAMPVAPSPVTEKTTKVTPRELTIAEIEGVTDDFYRAAIRAKGAGFDGVELHAAHGYLLNQFLSQHTNHRTDMYGGSPKNRARLVQEIIRRIKERHGDDLAILVKMNSSDFVPGGNKITEYIEIARFIAAAGADALEISGGMWESGDKIIRKAIKNENQEAYFRDEARQIKQVVSCPVILVGGLKSASVMEDVIARGYADFISLARPLLREPDLAQKLKDGKPKADCISCNSCLSPRAMPARCMKINVPDYLKKAIVKAKAAENRLERKSFVKPKTSAKKKAPSAKGKTAPKIKAKRPAKLSKSASKQKAAPKKERPATSLKNKLLRIKKRLLKK